MIKKREKKEDASGKEDKSIIEENKFSFIKDNITYILTCSKTNKDTIMLKIKKDEEIIYHYYEVECEYNKLSKLSKILIAQKMHQNHMKF